MKTLTLIILCLAIVGCGAEFDKGEIVQVKGSYWIDDGVYRISDVFSRYTYEINDRFIHKDNVYEVDTNSFLFEQIEEVARKVLYLERGSYEWETDIEDRITALEKDEYIPTEDVIVTGGTTVWFVQSNTGTWEDEEEPGVIILTTDNEELRFPSAQYYTHTDTHYSIHDENNDHSGVIFTIAAYRVLAIMRADLYESTYKRVEGDGR